MNTLITGATGFLGKNLLKRLLDRGESVRALVRDPKALGIEHPNLEIFQGDLSRPDTVAKALLGVRYVYHVAAAVKEWVKDWSVFDRVNVEGFESLLKVISFKKEFHRIVYTSSFMALGPSELATPDARDENGRATEDLIHDPIHHHNPYERTKYLAMLLAKKFAQKGLPIVTVHPGVIYGPGELTEGNLVVGMLLQMAQGKFPGIPGSGKQRWTYSYIDDVVEGHILAMENGRLGEHYILGGDSVTLDEFVNTASAQLGIKPPLRHLPLSLLDVSAFFMEQIAKLTGKPPMITRGKVGVLGHHWEYSSRKAVAEFGYPITPFTEGMRRTVEWMKNLGLISN